MVALGGGVARGCFCIALLTASGLGQAACEKAKPEDEVSEQRKGRKEPIWAVQECATGEILDDGCDETGRCVACVNSCTTAPPPSAARKEE